LFGKELGNSTLNLNRKWVRKLNALLNLVLIDLYGCDRDRLVNADLIEGGMLRAAELMGAEVIGHSFHTFKPWGVSGTVTIAESHLAVHTWPEYNFAAVTFETCGDRMDHRKAYRYLIEFFNAKDPKITHQRRGLMDIPDGAIWYKQAHG
jgi:S-adenosylmethionine decarboxylase proenzyme